MLTFRFNPGFDGDGLITNLSPRLGFKILVSCSQHSAIMAMLRMWILQHIPAGRRFFVTKGWSRFRRQASKLQSKVQATHFAET